MEKNQIKYTTCSFCGRNDVPICPGCGKTVPHGMVSGTWLPCHCGAMGEDTINQVLANVFAEHNHRKEVKPNEE